MNETVGPIQISDVIVKRGTDKNPKWEGGGRTHVPAKTGYQTPNGDSDHARHMPYEEIAPGVEFSVWANEKDREDGALIKIKVPSAVIKTNEIDERRKCATPVQEIKEGVTTREIPYAGDMGRIFGLFVVDNKLFVYMFDKRNVYLPQQMIKLKGGDTMCWIASRSAEGEVQINEHTTPPWSKDTFKTIEEDSENDKLPQAFWNIYHQLLNGNEESELIIEVGVADTV